jgi:hypothetical protein
MYAAKGGFVAYEKYWQDRKHLEYYQTVKTWLDALGKQESICDVGSAGTPVATFGNFNRRVALNNEPCPLITNVENVIDDWLLYEKQHFTVITCLQVIEHFETDYLRQFVAKIFDCCDVAIISVPYRWSEGACVWHVQDPIDYKKFLDLIGKDPVKTEIVNRRLIGMFT